MNTLVLGKKVKFGFTIVMLSLLAAVSMAIENATDKITTHKIWVLPDVYTSSYAYLTVSGWLGIASALQFFPTQRTGLTPGQTQHTPTTFDDYYGGCKPACFFLILQM